MSGGPGRLRRGASAADEPRRSINEEQSRRRSRTRIALASRNPKSCRRLGFSADAALPCRAGRRRRPAPPSRAAAPSMSAKPRCRELADAVPRQHPPPAVAGHGAKHPGIERGAMNQDGFSRRRRGRAEIGEYTPRRTFRCGPPSDGFHAMPSSNQRRMDFSHFALKAPWMQR